MPPFEVSLPILLVPSGVPAADLLHAGPEISHGFKRSKQEHGKRQTEQVVIAVINYWTQIRHRLIKGWRSCLSGLWA